MSLSVQSNVAMPQNQMAFRGEKTLTKKQSNALDVLINTKKNRMDNAIKNSKLAQVFEKLLLKLPQDKADKVVAFMARLIR